MAETLYNDVIWTAGDTITEAKLDNMTANDRAVDAMYNGILFTERANPDTPGSNKIHLFSKDISGLTRLFTINSGGKVQQVDTGGGTIYSITYSSSVTPNYQNGKQQSVTLTGNITVNTPTNMVTGDVLLLEFIQDGSGSRSITWFGGITWLSPDTTNNTGASKKTVYGLQKTSGGFNGYLVGKEY